MEKSGVVEIGPQGVKIGHRPGIKGEASAGAPRSGRAVQSAGNIEYATRRADGEIPGLAALGGRGHRDIAAVQQSHAALTRG